MDGVAAGGSGQSCAVSEQSLHLRFDGVASAQARTTPAAERRHRVSIVTVFTPWTAVGRNYRVDPAGRDDEVLKVAIFSEKMIKVWDFFCGESFRANHNGPLTGSVSIFASSLS
jgi:hypothetical protein